MRREKNTDISVFLDTEGKIRQLPASARMKRLVAAYLAGKFAEGKMYSEKEVNARIDVWHTFGDYFVLRRLMVDCGFMGRRADGSAYWRVPEPGRREDKKCRIEKKN